MHTTTSRRLLGSLLGTACGLFAPWADAGDLQIATIRGAESVPVGIADMLHRSLAYHSVAVEQWFKDATAHVPVVRNDYVPLRGHFQKATYAELEYSYEQDGEMRTVVYHAVSGNDAPYYLKSPASQPSTPKSPVPGETAPGWSTTKHFDEYFPTSDVQSRARILASDNTELFSDDTLVDDKFPHGRDAELKGVRSIERDIQAGKIPRGGTIQAAVSKPVCGSCQAAVRKFADIYDVDVHVTEFGEGSQAWSSFASARKEIAQRIWGHTVQRQTSGSGPSSSSGSLADDFGEEILSLCGSE
jgi:hypothetical protein